MRKSFFIMIATAGLIHPAFAQTLAKVGGVSITLEQVIAADPAAKTDPAIRNKVLIALVNRQAVLNDAKKIGLEQTPDYQTALAQAKENILINLEAKNFAAANPISDQQISDEYNNIFSKPAPDEYRFREILVASFADAQSVITELKAGQSFSILAAKTSTDQSAAIGGEVGWQVATQLSAPILKTLKTMQVGQIAGPISLPQGYVVIQLLGVRLAPKPALDQVKAKISAALQQQEWIDQVIKLRKAQGAQLIVPLAGG